MRATHELAEVVARVDRPVDGASEDVADVRAPARMTDWSLGKPIWKDEEVRESQLHKRYRRAPRYRLER